MKQWKIAVMRNAGRNPVSSNRSMTRWFYDVIGRFYDLLYHRLIRGYVESAGALMDEVIEEGDMVLDVGCGTGLLTYLAEPKAKGVVGIDLSMGMLQKARRKKKLDQNLLFLNGDALNLPLKPEFDCCVSAFMLVMLPKEKRWQVIQQMYGLLKPGGRVAFLTSRRDLGSQWFSGQEWKEGLKKIGLEHVQVSFEGDVFMNITGIKPDPNQSSLRRKAVTADSEVLESSPLYKTVPTYAN